MTRIEAANRIIADNIATTATLLGALIEIRDGLADTQSTPGQRMTLMTKREREAWQTADVAIKLTTGGGT
jgi:hypothetical protein